MAYTTGDKHYTEAPYVSNTIGRTVQFVEVDRLKGAGSTTVYDKLVPVYNGEMITVYGIRVVTGGTATCTTDVGIVDAAGTEVDADGFLSAVDTSTTDGTLIVPDGAYIVTGGEVATYTNVTGATVYLSTNNGTAADLIGKTRIYFEKQQLS